MFPLVDNVVDNVARIMAGCDLAAGPVPGRCWWCGDPLPPGRDRFCTRRCVTAVRVEHMWEAARREALARAHGRCWCGDLAVHVHHDPPVVPGEYGPGCAHHQAHLYPVCVAHHRQLHAHTTVIQPSLFAA